MLSSPQARGSKEQQHKDLLQQLSQGQDKDFLVPRCHSREEREEGQNLEDASIYLKEAVID